MTERPIKPEGFPLYPHASGKWAKKVGGKLMYFGRWDDSAAALVQYEAFLAAQQGTKQSIGLTVANAANAFLAAKEKAVERGELAKRSWSEYRDTCQRFAAHVGHDRLVDSLGPADFTGFRDWRSQAWNLIAVGNEVTRIRSMFKWCAESRLMREIPHYGPDFKRPGVKAIRKHRRAQGKKLFQADEILRMLDESGLQMRAMILLGINCGFGNTDCATLPRAALDFKPTLDVPAGGGWIDYPRPKTEIDRRCPLWPETALALKSWIERRPNCDIKSLFVLPERDDETWDNNGNPIAKRFRQIMLWAGIKRGGFYWLRHTFETIGGGAKDQVAVNAIMGHADASMAAVYREEIEDARLVAVAAHVRAWLFGPDSGHR